MHPAMIEEVSEQSTACINMGFVILEYMCC